MESRKPLLLNKLFVGQIELKFETAERRRRSKAKPRRFANVPTGRVTQFKLRGLCSYHDSDPARPSTHWRRSLCLSVNSIGVLKQT